jgi:hypothetical protein
MRNNRIQYIYIILASGLLLSGCLNTEGTLNIKGKVIDEDTKMQIPGRDIIVQGLLENDNKFIPVDAGRLSTDSSGCFTYSLKKVKDARYYNICLVGDSAYASTTNKISLFQLETNAKYLFFSLNKLENLTIKIQKISKSPYRDTLYLTWESNKVDFRALYPYKVENFGITDNLFGVIPSLGLRWIGGNINSIVKTKVYSDKMTILSWELVRNKKRMEFKDTIMCKRDVGHYVNFTY